MNIYLAFPGADDAKKVVVDGWGNPPSAASDILGMIVPATASPLEDTGWGAVVTYVNDGHIDDADANSINYSELLSNIQASETDANKARAKDGYETMHIVGWATPPTYNSSSKVLIWAKELSIGTNPVHTLNYDVRVLGREGVLSLNAVAGMSDLPAIKVAMVKVAGATTFNPGKQYGDYVEGTDNKAAYGLAALVAGGVAAKAGLFKGILIALLAAKKFVIIGVIALGVLIKKIFTGVASSGKTGGRGEQA